MYVAAAIATIVTSFFSDNYKNRGNFVLGLQLATLAGFVMAGKWSLSLSDLP